MDNLEISRLPDEITAPPPEEIRTACHEDIPPRVEEVPQKRSRRSAIRQFLLVGAAAVTVAAAALTLPSNLPQPNLDPACYELLNETMVAFQNEDIARVMELWDSPEAFGWYTGDLANYRQWLIDEGYVEHEIVLHYHNGQFETGQSSISDTPYLSFLLGSDFWSMSYCEDYSYFWTHDAATPEESPLLADCWTYYDENGRLGCVRGEFWRVDGETDRSFETLNYVPQARVTRYDDFHYDSARLNKRYYGSGGHDGGVILGYRKVEGTFVRIIDDDGFAGSYLSDGTMQLVEASGLVHTLYVTDGFIDGAVTQLNEYGTFTTKVTDDRGLEWTFYNDDDIGLPGQYLCHSFLGGWNKNGRYGDTLN